MTTTAVRSKSSEKVDQKVAPGALIGASIEFSGNGGVIVTWDHAPEKGKNGNMIHPYDQPRRRDTFTTVEEACHAICQAKGGDSCIEEYDEKKAA